MTTSSRVSRRIPLGDATDVLLGYEEQRVRFMGWFILVLCVASMLALLLEGARIQVRPVASAGVALLVASSVITLTFLRFRPYHQRLGVVFGLCCVIGLGGGYTHWGPYSIHVVYLPFGVFLFGLSGSRRGAIAMLVVGLLMHAIPAMLVVTGAVSDDGIFVAAAKATKPALVRALVLVQAATIGAFYIARRLRASSVRALAELEQTQRALARQEALLAEAQRDFSRGSQMGGPGRYTEHVLGSYRIGFLLGRGGMGEVYLAESIAGDGVQAAVKVLHTHLLGDPQLVRRFLREAELASALDTPNVVRVLEVAGPDAILPYIAMERLHGENLADWLRQVPAAPARSEVAAMLSAVASGLQAAHAQGIIHRDLKPQNIFRHLEAGDPPRVVWKVLDFGVATLVGGGSLTITQSEIFGTPAYMAPEQAAGERVDARADVYGLGAVIYRVLTGRAPFEVTGVRATLMAVLTQAPIRPRDLAPIPEELELVLAVALARAAADRFATPLELAEAFADATRGALAPALRQRAEAVLGKRPWGRLAPSPRSELIAATELATSAELTTPAVGSAADTRAGHLRRDR